MENKYFSVKVTRRETVFYAVKAMYSAAIK